MEYNHNKPVMDINQYKRTRDMFKEYIAAQTGDTFPMDYETWSALPDEAKAPALYVNFFDSIQYAVYNSIKNGYSWVDESLLINNILVYLMRAIKGEKITKKNYTKGYVGTIISHAFIDEGKKIAPQNMAQSETSNIVPTADGEVDLFNTISDHKDLQTDVHSKQSIYDFWDVIATLDKDCLAVLDSILNGSKLGKRRAEKLPDIMMKLRAEFFEFRDLIPGHKDTFKDVYSDYRVESVECIMRDGTHAVYCGEQIVDHETGKSSVVFMGPEKDYIIPLTVAFDLQVESIETI